MSTFSISELMSEHLSLSEEEKAAIDECIPIREYTKGHLLLRDGQIARDSYFTLKGCVRHYFIIDGEERTTAFYTEGDSISSMSSYANQIPANHYLECVESCTLAVLNFAKERELYDRVQGFESMCHAFVERDLGLQQQAMATYIVQSPEERYLDLLENRPELLQRVPQYQLASYIGVKPESLSRIRRRISKK